MSIADIFYIVATIFFILFGVALVFITVTVVRFVQSVNKVLLHVERSMVNFRVVQETVKLSALKTIWNILKPFTKGGERK